YLLRQIEQVLSEIGINCSVRQTMHFLSYCHLTLILVYQHHTIHDGRADKKPKNGVSKIE
ncbi:hypothetical protein, partial [Pseudoalteromonas rubra]|uniref:hypothetical protein n=1 Tax=Pseudoalteromonas rubra TaxID=43658 RepID=UPI001980BEF0